MMNIFGSIGDLSFYGTRYDNFLLLGHLNIYRDDKCSKEFCNYFSLGHLIKTPTCYMCTNPSSIDHFITNLTSLFMKFYIVETGISDNQKLIIHICSKRFRAHKNTLQAKIS